MIKEMPEIPKLVFLGLCLCMMAILFGFLLGGAFGMMEETIKESLNDSGVSVLETTYKGDVTAKDAVVDKSWSYLKRAHMHGGAIGSAGVAVILSLIVLCRLNLVAQMSALAFGLGAVVYPVFWLVAGFIAPGMGSTGDAKEVLDFLAIPGAGLTLAGLCGAIYCIIRGALGKGASD